MTANPRRQRSWLRSIQEAADHEHIPLPSFVDMGMGSALCRAPNGQRFVSYKRRPVSARDALHSGVEWTLWLEDDGYPTTIAIFREALTATPERVAAVLAILRGWLIDHWTVEAAEHVAAEHPNARVGRIPRPKMKREEYWLSGDRAFGIIVESDRWSLRSHGEFLSVWRKKNDADLGDGLEQSSLDRLCLWLARQWSAITFGNDIRPTPLRELKVAASQAYADVQLKGPSENQEEIAGWWSRHAIRATDAELPNFFFERQADELVVSWDAEPSLSRFYKIPYGEAVLPVNFAVPVLRQLVRARLKSMQLDEPERATLLSATAEDASSGYRALAHYQPTVSKAWLNSSGFTDEDARSFAIAGESRHPVVGLLRTSQGSSLTIADCEKVFRLLKPSDARSYHKLRELANGMSAALNAREPWESGYRLAALVRQKLGKAPADHFDVEQTIREFGIEVHGVPFTDATVLGACVGSPAYAPLIVLNPSCADASGPSGRRITLAHEWCHLLFDRSRMLGLARFEGRGADSDRLIEMRANAFAVELLAPMSTLIGADGSVLNAEGLQPISVAQQVSLDALTRHAGNLRERLARR
ncbi:MAG: ImmA/IrrE family metallo-endopeptidase [Planctomycetia bacterium]|nr:ImmA/IrrE family metallo-endopeptidase [Planctomycetia bacterium]